MDSGLIISPAVTAASAASRAEPIVMRGGNAPSVATDIAPQKAVAGLGESQDSGQTGRRPPSLPSPNGIDASLIVQELSIDPATHTVVSSKVEKDSGYVLNQFPDKAALRQKVYFRQMLDRMTEQHGGQNDSRA